MLVQFPHAISGMGNPNKDGRRGRREGLDITHGDVEWADFTAHFFDQLNGFGFGAAEVAWRQDRDMTGPVRMFGMQFPTELLDELADRVPHVRHEGMKQGRHTRKKEL
jgi:methionine synthase II (cobalamin-independent)